MPWKCLLKQNDLIIGVHVCLIEVSAECRFILCKCGKKFLRMHIYRFHCNYNFNNISDSSETDNSS